MKFLILLAPLALVGCALTLDERQAIVDEAARVAADAAHKRAIEAGLPEEEARKLADQARAEAAALAAKAIPQAEEQKRGKFGAVLASVLLAVVQLASAGLKRGVA